MLGQEGKTKLLHIQVFRFHSLCANSWADRPRQKVADEDKFEILKTTSFSPNAVMIFHL